MRQTLIGHDCRRWESTVGPIAVRRRSYKRSANIDFSSSEFGFWCMMAEEACDMGVVGPMTKAVVPAVVSNRWVQG
jgi:hypothetical protein